MDGNGGEESGGGGRAGSYLVISSWCKLPAWRDSSHAAVAVLSQQPRAVVTSVCASK